METVISALIAAVVAIVATVVTARRNQKIDARVAAHDERVEYEATMSSSVMELRAQITNLRADLASATQKISELTLALDVASRNIVHLERQVADLLAENRELRIGKGG